MNETDLVVVGGGVMGLFTAYHAANLGQRVVVLERGRVGDPKTASYGRTRTYRNDYLDPAYVRLAREAIRLWDAFEAREDVQVLVRCGCLNIASERVTPDLDATYARMSHVMLEALGLPSERLDRDALQARFEVLDADEGQLDEGAGVADLQAVRATLVRVLAERGVRIVEGAEPTAIESSDAGVTVTTSAGATLHARALVVTAGHGTNDVLATTFSPLAVPIEKDRPSDARYYDPPDPEAFTAGRLPVVAYLDAGIYVHPIVPGVVDAVKVGYYNPPDVPRGTTSIASIDDFVDQCFPGLAGVPHRKVEDVDGCDYDLVADDDFVLGAVPGVPHAYLGVGWRGTGYKFAPWVGRVLAELAVQGGTVYDVSRFDPARFTEGLPHAAFPANPAPAAR
jgi:glycine/D-amino acid oxidase-like deaminating enzyme